ncbi:MULTISPECIES: penicillin-binding protein 1A [Bacillaceae]|uniref:PBP1A family penicillin-binding protein n=1 Tax=Evansella alkalicola TaxID=745819 RepID=A0ABS6JZ86_9BACI|nr:MULTISPECIES: penicillin-binding protein 1A [Bacillaceae]MBU9723905.1 PBP1A family penicillin-binding protein [Bacillus alkalicola]
MSEYRTRQERKQQKQKQKSHKKDKSTFKKRFKKILIAFGIIALVMMLIGGITVFSIIRDAPELDPDKLTLANNPEIYDRDTELVTTLQAHENRRSVNINDVPDVLKNAVIAVEDIRFYDHFGLDMRRIGGAVVANITGGFGAEGASTITQQVVKNLFLSSEKTVSRKLQEQYLAIRLEQKFSKDQILEMYLNVIYFDDGYYGVQSAADYYFSKELEELEIEDAALLAGIPQRPVRFNPFKNPEDAKVRRDTVISLMERYEKITPEEAEAARNVAIEDQLQRSEREANPYQAFIDTVFKEVESIEGIDSTDIYTGGLKIYTTLDRDLQEHVEHLMQSGEFEFPDENYQAGITVLDTQTGQVLAIGGHRKPAEGALTYNMATNPRRQPGSAIKPILDYGPAVDEFKWSTYHQIVDEPYYYQTGEKTEVRNFDRNHRGSVSIREALRISLNVPAVKAFNEVGIDKAKAFGERLGLGAQLENIQESYSIGGFSEGLSSFQMAGAYAAFGNNGEYNAPHTVTRVEFPDGTVIDLTPEPVIAMNDYTAFMITDMLKTVVQSGTGTAASVPGVPIAGKTGSSNYTQAERERFDIPSTGTVKDSWFAGYSPHLTAAVWTGYANHDDGFINTNAGEGQIARALFKQVMTYAHEGMEVNDFVQPDSVVRVGIERSTGLLPSEFTPQSEIIHEYFVRGTEPKEVSEEFEHADPVSNLEATYDEENHEINISWSYPEELLDQFSFRLEVNDGNDDNYTLIDVTKSMAYNLSNPSYDTNYTIRVTVVSDDNAELESDPTTVSVRIPEEEVEEPEEEEEDFIDDLVDDLIGDDEDDGTNNNDGDTPPSDGDQGENGDEDTDDPNDGNDEDSGDNGENNNDDGDPAEEE